MPESKFRLCWYQPMIENSTRGHKSVSRMIIEQHRGHSVLHHHHGGWSSKHPNTDCYYRIDLVEHERVIHITKGSLLKLRSGRLDLCWDPHLPPNSPFELWFDSGYQAQQAFAAALVDATVLLTLSVL